MSIHIGKGSRIYVDFGKNLGEFTVTSAIPFTEVSLTEGKSMGIGRAVQILRDHFQTSVSDLAHRAGIRQRRLEAIENGRFIPARNASETRDLAKAFGITPEQLQDFAQKDETRLNSWDYPQATKIHCVVADKRDHAAQWLRENSLVETGKIIGLDKDFLGFEPHRIEVYLIGPCEFPRTKELIGRAIDRGLTIYDMRESAPPKGVTQAAVDTADAIAGINEKS